MVKKEASKETQKEKAVSPDTGGGFSATRFLKGTQEELAKVVWPTRQQLISESAAVILMVSLSATTIYFIDQLFSWISGRVF
ncbi:MAG: preprotein translocase subunit SecE [Leptolyngbya sp. RL_3_1]|nr:preprotein translocase subunit SecE [Leptolyngbya sp. RL_3_1]